MESISKMLDCPICFEKMSQPKMLPCQHTFCVDCLSRIAQTEVRLDDDPLFSDDGFESAWTYVECSICRKIHTVPGNKYHLISRIFF